MSTHEVAGGARDDDVALWLAWKRVAEVTRARVLTDVLVASGLSEAELTVLVHLHDAGGALRQNALASAAAWDRTRLSHVLTRMAARGLVDRVRLANGVQVRALPPGVAVLAETREPLAGAVDRHVMSRLDGQQREALRVVTQALAD